MALAGAITLSLSALLTDEWLFVVSSLLAIALGGSITPLLTQIYQDNYPDASRGRYFARTVMIRIGSAVAFAAGAGYLLSVNIGYFRIVLAIFAAALAFSLRIIVRRGAEGGVAADL